MLVTNITFLLVIGIGIMFSTILAFHYKGIFWLAFLSGIFWLVFGIWCRTTIDITFMYQRELAVLFIFIGIAMFLSPFWLKAKQADIETPPPDDIDIWLDKQKSDQDRVDKLKMVRKRYRRNSGDM